MSAWFEKCKPFPHLILFLPSNHQLFISFEVNQADTSFLPLYPMR